VNDPFDPKNLRIETTLVKPRKIRKRREKFVAVPWVWMEKLNGQWGSHIYQIAFRLLYQHWKQGGGPVKLANGMLEFDGIDRYVKYRTLKRLEQLGLITVERRRRKSPVVHLRYVTVVATDM
jgi:hypothetical protein